MEYTGERVIPDAMRPTNKMLLEHMARYRFARGFAHGRVLDLACGSGYGTPILMEGEAGEGIQELVGLDLSEEAVAYARRRYPHPKATYAVADGRAPDLVERFGVFDTVISFETVEHMAEDRIFIGNLFKLLRPGGTAVISTPWGKGRGQPCGEPFHFWQYTRAEFLDLLSVFPEVDLYEQFQERIEKPVPGQKYFLAVAVCRK